MRSFFFRPSLTALPDALTRPCRAALDRLGLSMVALAAFVFASLAGEVRAQPTAFPADTDWRVIYCGGVAAYDPLGDATGGTGERDIVGDANAPALYYFASANYLFFRMRLNADPANNGNFSPFGWGAEFDTDGDRQTYELLDIVDGISNPDQVTLWANTTQTQLNNPADPADTVLQTYPNPGYARSVLAADSTFGGDPDYFVDWAIPLADLQAQNVSMTDPLAFVFGTSNNAQALNADLACHDAQLSQPTLTAAGTDLTRLDGMVVPNGVNTSSGGGLSLRGGGGPIPWTCTVAAPGAATKTSLLALFGLAGLLLALRRRRSR